MAKAFGPLYTEGNKFFVSFHCLRTAHSFCHHQILMGIQHHVFVLVFPHKIFPGFQLKGIVDQMNLEYLARHISKELHTFVRIYTPFSGTYRLEYSCCGRPDFLDREVLNTSLLQVLLDLGTQTCPPLVLINGSFSYVAGSVENRRFLLGPFRLASQIPAKYTQEVPPVSGAWLSSLSICSLSVLSANVLLLYNLFTAVPLTEEEWIAENCPQEYTNFELEENFSRQVFSNREMQIRHNPYDQELREFGSIEKGDAEGLMKSWEGISMKQFILREKIRLCKNIPTYSPYSYSAIAAYLGFSSQSHLGKLFKKETGMTLGDYRLKYGVKKLWGAEGRW